MKRFLFVKKQQFRTARRALVIRYYFFYTISSNKLRYKKNYNKKYTNFISIQMNYSIFRS